jgi:hypothetical protein
MKCPPRIVTRLGADDRGASTVVGAVLVFGLLVALLSIIQLQAVPSANAGVEYEHSQAAQGDLDRLAESIDRTVETGNSEAVGVALGTQYPTRLVTFNPPPPSGSLRTEARGNLTLFNATASGPAGAFLNGTNKRYPTHSLVYEANYNEYDGAPTRVREVGVGYNGFDNASIVRTQPFIDGATIELVTFNRSFDRAAAGSELIEPTDVSGPARTVPIRSEGADEPLEIAVPTQLNNETWTEILEDQLVQNGGHIESFTVNETTGRLRVRLEPSVTYDLRMADIGFGNAGTAEPHYMVASPSSDGPASVDIGREGKVSVEVRDRYNNPVDGVDLRAKLLPGNGTISNGSVTGGTVDVTTNASGIATVTYDAPNNFDAETVAFFPAANQSGFDDPRLDVGTVTVLTGLEGNQPVIMTQARGDTGGTDELQLSLQNLGEQREVIGVELDSAKEITGLEVASRAGLSGTLGGIVDDIGDLTGLLTGGAIDFNLIQEDASKIAYTPGGITGLEVENATQSSSSSVSAARSGRPSFVTGTQLPALKTGETADLTFTFDEKYQVGSDTVFAAEITVYFTGGYSETYQIQLAP